MFHRFTHIAVAAAILLAAVLRFSAVPAAATTVSALYPAAPAYALGPVISTGACTVPDSPAKMTREFPVDWLEIQAAQGILEGEAIVMINLDNNGTLTGARLQDSSGNPALDDAALVLIRNSSYAPEVQHCNRVARDYYVKVIFQ
ncbi:MAG: energy transducer TonB [Candidatus Eremiobacteraeota bacterium]|nr:energy transducer TonB [Candidatus Eremiobacteraeota bacterium]MBV8223160.1 energy transducer TonB [Candidatus Eremiobacteraeota bacterium]